MLLVLKLETHPNSLLPNMSGHGHSVLRRNIKRNIMKKEMEWEEDAPLEDLNLELPGRAALGALRCVYVTPCLFVFLKLASLHVESDQ